jgi:hypothetical protein
MSRLVRPTNAGDIENAIRQIAEAG